MLAALAFIELVASQQQLRYTTAATVTTLNQRQDYDDYDQQQITLRPVKPTKVTYKKVLKRPAAVTAKLVSPQKFQQPQQQQQQRKLQRGKFLDDNIPQADQKSYSTAVFEENNDNFSRRRARFLFMSRVGK